MTCAPRTFPFGYQQTLTYQITPGDSISVVLDNQNYKPEGDGYLGYLGYDRYQDPDLTTTLQQSVMGSSYLNGPVFRTPYKFSWNLQQLTLGQYMGLWAIYKRQQQEKREVRLYDTRLALDEAGATRTRAKCGTYPVPGAPTIPRMQFFYPIFRVWLDFGQERESYNVDKFSLKFTGIELDPKYPIDPTEDAP